MRSATVVLPVPGLPVKLMCRLGACAARPRLARSLSITSSVKSVRAARVIVHGPVTFAGTVSEVTLGGLTGSTLTIAKILTNSSTDVNGLSIGNSGITSDVTVTASELVNTGQINLIGSSAYSARKLQKVFQLRTANWLSWYRQDDRYSREQLDGDLEALRAWYLDRGYADFEISSTQVSIDPAKTDLFVTVNLSEGQVWSLGAVKMAGRFVVPEPELRALLQVSPGQRFSQRSITASETGHSGKFTFTGSYTGQPAPASWRWRRPGS